MSSGAPPEAAAPDGGGPDRGGVSEDLRRAFVNMAAKAGSIAIERVAQLVLMLGAAPILGVVSFGRFSFANETQLDAMLGIKPGAVSPFAVINDSDGAVTTVIDAALLEIAPLNLHPLRNDRTTAIAATDLVRFLESCGHAPRVMALARAE